VTPLPLCSTAPPSHLFISILFSTSLWRFWESLSLRCFVQIPKFFLSLNQSRLLKGPFKYEKLFFLLNRDLLFSPSFPRCSRFSPSTLPSCPLFSYFRFFLVIPPFPSEQRSRGFSGPFPVVFYHPIPFLSLSASLFLKRFFLPNRCRSQNDY